MSAALQLIQSTAPPPKERHYRPPGPTAARFLRSVARFVGIRGPFGSGKSTVAVAKILVNMQLFPPCRDGVRRSRWAIVRNTYPELKSTTIKTWGDWANGAGFGEIVYGAPISQQIRFADEAGQITHEVEIWFLALDRPEHVKKLLSMELSGGWVNEAREVPKAIVDAIDSRIDRYPAYADKHPDVSDEEWLRFRQVLMDTNSMDQDHWWYKMAEEVQPEGWEFFKQPAGDTSSAENVHNLLPGYYQRLKIGKSLQWVKVYIRNEYGTVTDGKPVYPEYNDNLHYSAAELTIMRGLPLFLGWDFGRTPAVVFAQITPRGQLRIIDEIAVEDMGVTNFAARVVKPHIANNYRGMEILSIIDPAGLDGVQNDETTAFEILEGLGFKPEGAVTNNFSARREAVANSLSWSIEGQPGLLLGPKAKLLRAGFLGRYEMRRMQVPGEDRWAEEPKKNKYSHPHDALQYIALRLEVPSSPKVHRLRRGAAPAGPADSTAGY